MDKVQVEQKSYEMPPQHGITVAHVLTVADIERSARFYETVFGGRILSRGDREGAPGFGITVSYWRTLEDIANWKKQSEHLEAQAKGKKVWYAHYEVRICKVERQYGVL